MNPLLANIEPAAHSTAIIWTYAAYLAISVALTVWVYYSAQILFLGAEFAQVYATRRGHRILPTKNALLLAESKLAESKARDREANAWRVSKSSS